MLDVPDNSNPAAQDEIFGPVICVIGYRDVDHAVEIANDSVFGLAGQVFGGDVVPSGRPSPSASAPARCSVNGGYTGAYACSGGYKQSGIGRERGVDGIRAFQQVKHLGGRQPVTEAAPSVPVFEGVRVVELAQFCSSRSRGALLADWGADVIKIEHPVTGDGYRGLVSQGILQLSSSGVNQSMELANRGKRSIGLDVAIGRGTRPVAPPRRAPPTSSSPTSCPTRSTASGSASTSSAPSIPT